MMKTLTIACVAGLSMMTAAVAGTRPSAKTVVPPPAPAPACAGGISYDNLSADWTHTWLDGTSHDVNGVDLNLEKTIVDKLYFHGSVSWADTDVDQWGFLAGLGYGIPLVKNIDLVAEAGALFSDDEGYNAWYVFPHLRGKWGCLEVHAGAKLICPDGDSNFWEAHVDAFYEVTQNLDLHVGGIFSDDADTLRVGLRYKF